MNSLIHNLNIPGWANPDILNVLGKYAVAVPENGTILELGGLFGRSTYTLGANKKASVELITIDVWPTMKNHRFHDQHCGVKEKELIETAMQGDPPFIHGDDFFNLWKFFTKDIINSRGIKGRTSMPIDNLPEVDLLYHDAGHTFDDVFNDLNHWISKLKKDGIIIVDDYEINQFPGVVGAVDLFAKQHGFNIEMVTNRNVLLRKYQ